MYCVLYLECPLREVLLYLEIGVEACKGTITIQFMVHVNEQVEID